jgi:hypothetical protein
MLACEERVLGHGKMLRVGCADVDCIDCGITQHIVVIGRNGGDREAFAQVPRRFYVSAGNRSHFDRFNSPHSFGMNSAHESGAENCCPDCFHRYCFLIISCPILFPADFLPVS